MSPVHNQAEYRYDTGRPSMDHGQGEWFSHHSPFPPAGPHSSEAARSERSSYSIGLKDHRGPPA
eukprot:3229771-Prymnesium_polylepis.1